MARRHDVSVAWPDYTTASGLPLVPSKKQVAPAGVIQPIGTASQRKTSEPTKTKKLRTLPMSKTGRAAARKNLSGTYDIASGKSKTMPTSKQRMRPGMDPRLNNPNDVGAKIIPVGTPSTL